MKDGDEISRLLFSVIDNLMLRNPKGVTSGVLLGVTLSIFSKVLQPYVLSKTGYIDLSVVNFLEWIFLGVAICSVPYFLKPDLPGNASAVLIAIKAIQKSSLSSQEKRYRQRKLLEDFSKSILSQDSVDDRSLDRQRKTISSDGEV